MDDTSFGQFIACVRAGDEGAARRLVRDQEPEIRAYIRKRLHDPRLQRVLDSADICQSVLGEFFKRVVTGQFDLVQPEDLAKLLTVMARNKLLKNVAAEGAAKRGGHFTRADPDQLAEVAGTEPTPSEIVGERELRQEKAQLLQQVLGLLSSAERQLLDQWEQGRTWAQIAAAAGNVHTPEALKKKLLRALKRVKDQLGIKRVQP